MDLQLGTLEGIQKLTIRINNMLKRCIENIPILQMKDEHIGLKVQL
jgi:hypothetical protein